MRHPAPFHIVRPASLVAGLALLGCAQICRSQVAPASSQTGPQISPQTSPDASFNTSGQVTRAGRTVPYVIFRLPVSSFPDLPSYIQSELDSRGCLIPQTYEAHQPENVVHGSFEQPGSSDWAVLCSARGTVSLLVFFGAHQNPGQHPNQEPFVLTSAPETERLQPHSPASTLGFNWAIDSASPQQVRDAQAGLQPHPPAVDHDALADSTIDHRTVYHFYTNGAWTLLDTPQQ